MGGKQRASSIAAELETFDSVKKNYQTVSVANIVKMLREYGLDFNKNIKYLKDNAQALVKMIN